MLSKPVALGLVAVASVLAGAGGMYLALRGGDVQTPVQVASASGATDAGKTAEAAPVTATEAVVPDQPTEPEPSATAQAPAPATPPARVPTRVAAPVPAPTVPPRVVPSPATTGSPAPARADGPAPVRAEPGSDGRSPQPDATGMGALQPAPDVVPVSQLPAAPAPAPPAAPAAEYEELVVSADSVIGLQVDSTVTSETARVEDPVDGHVTRDVRVDGRVAIPAGTRVLGSVTQVERGGKMKDKARLGFRFHTLLFRDGSRVQLNTDPIYREGESPGKESAAKIGGAAVGGALLGALLGGGKGAAIGSAIGAAGGTAATMAGNRNAAVIQAGSPVTVRLNAPVTIEVERE